MELLKQDQYDSIPFEEQVCLFFAGTAGYLDNLPLEEIKEFEIKIREELKDRQQDILKEIRETGDFTESVQERLKQVLEGLIKEYDFKTSPEK